MIRIEDLSDELAKRQRAENKLFFPDGRERSPGTDETGEYSTAQMIYDDAFGGNTEELLYD